MEGSAPAALLTKTNLQNHALYYIVFKSANKKI